MGVFHVFQTAKMIPIWAEHHICNQRELHLLGRKMVGSYEQERYWHSSDKQEIRWGPTFVSSLPIPSKH